MDDFLDQISALPPQRLALLAVKLKEQLDRAQEAAEAPIAVIGVGCRFPGASGPDAFWDMLKNGREGIREVPPERWPIDAYFDPDPDAPGKMSTRMGGFLEGIDKFDPAFFGIAPREAVAMDPQQRLLLEVGWEALENAGLAPTSLMGSRTGVYVGICNADYHQLLLGRGLSSIDAYQASGNAQSVASGRLSYFMGLQGPCMTIDTSCSASLVAIHSACQSLRLGESSLALAGGVNLICAPETSIALSKTHMLAADGRCKTFDAAADGFSRGEGCGMVVLKRLSDAKRDGDRILAVVRGSAVNQDGKSSGLTAPNGPAQESVIRDALASARLRGSDIDYVEAHGTGTSLGDPIEIRALGRVLGEGRDLNTPLLIGSVKTNIGHLESAAGVAGFIKVVLSLQHEAIPRHLNFKNPNPFIEWANLPVAVVDRTKPWSSSARRRRAGVSSFGFSGTNAHIILEEAPPEVASFESVDRPLHCLTISAQSEASLRELIRLHAETLAPENAVRLSDVAHVAGTGRAHLKHRLAIVAADEAEARAALLAANAGEADPKVRRGKVTPGQSAEVVFLYTGAGAQYPGMGRALYRTSPVFRDAIDLCDRLLQPDEKGRTLKSVLWQGTEGEPAIHEIGWTQPAMFAIEYALTTLWRSWGVAPAAVIGHSVGEYAAACAAGVFSLEDGLRLIAERGRLMQSLPPGGMMAALFAPIDEIEAAIAPLRDRVAIAAINAPGGVVISGETSAVETVLAAFAQRNVIGQRLFVSLAAHSPLVEPALDRMEALARGVAMARPSIPIVWNLTGRPLPNGAAPDAVYWRRHMREPVRFADGVKALHDDGFRIFLEVGPHPTLLALAQQSLPAAGNLLLTSLRRGKDDWNELLTSLADLHVNGAPVDFVGFDRPYQRRRVTLPTYPFDRERYWAAPVPHPDRRGADGGVVAAAEGASQANGIYYKIAWKPAASVRADRRASSKRDEQGDAGADQASAAAEAKTRRRWIVLADRGELGARLAPALAASGDAVAVMEPREWRAAIESSQSTGKGPVFADDETRDGRDGAAPQSNLGIIYLGALDENDENAPESNRLSLEFLKYAARANEGKVWLVTKGAVNVRGLEDVTSPDQAALWGLGRTFAREHSFIWGGLLDLDPAGDTSDSVAAVLNTVSADDDEDQIAWRDGSRRAARLVPDAAPAPSRPFSARPDRAYLITGGLGGIGLQVAAWLADNGARHLVLVGRTPLPTMQSGARGDDVRSAAVARLEERGIAVSVAALDVSDPIAMASMMSRFGREWPRLGGVVHAAVALTASPLANMPSDDLLAMMRTKVGAARLLHGLATAQPVEFFVNFSSGAALLGQVQYAHYAAANAALDALACHWAAQGDRALSVNWGTWEQMWSLRSEDREGMAKAGFRPMPAAVALDALGRLLAAGASHAIVADIDGPALRDLYESRGERSLLSELSNKGAGASGAGGKVERPENLVVDLSSVSPPERLRLIDEKVRLEVARVLGLSDPRSINPGQSLFELGLDSLMAMELRRRLGDIAETTFPAALAFNYPNVSALVALVDETVGARAQTAGDAEEIGELLSRIDDLSGAELDSLLAQMQREESAP
jgi:acyl transferase domain-containing protein/acyl carrier protein